MIKIESVKTFTTSDGVKHFSVEEAQKHELNMLFTAGTMEAGEPGNISLFIDQLYAEKERVIDILTTKPSSRPTARKSNGGRKTRKAKTDPASAAQTSDTVTA